MTTTDRANTFSQVKKGYDPAEVDKHLNDLRRSFGAELESERARVRELEAAVAAAKEREEAIHLTLVAASRTRDEMLATAQVKLDEATTAADAAAEAILKQAKFEAFRLVTEAREDADRLIAEARERAESVPAASAEADQIVSDAIERAAALVAEAEATAAAAIAAAQAERASVAEETEATRAKILAEARSQAMAILTGAKEDADAIRNERHEAEAERQEHLLAQIADLKAHIAGLEEEITRLHSAASERLVVTDPLPLPAANGNGNGSYTKTRFAHGTVEPIGEEEPARPIAASAPTAAVVVEEVAVDVDADIVVEERVPVPADEELGGSKRGSFYSRRSAKLPRIGEESGRNALAAMNGLRGHITASSLPIEESEDEGEHRGSAPDLAVQSA